MRLLNYHKCTLLGEIVSLIVLSVNSRQDSLLRCYIKLEFERTDEKIGMSRS